MTSSASRPDGSTTTRHLPALPSVADGPHPVSNTGFVPQVHQAAGILAVQLNCTIDEAMTTLQAQAATAHRAVETVAKEIISALFSPEDDARARDLAPLVEGNSPR